jgi:hypothetical protein
MPKDIAHALLMLQLHTLTKAEILALTGLSPNGFEMAVLAGRAPAPLPRLTHTRLWLRTDVMAWLAGPAAPRPRTGRTSNTSQSHGPASASSTPREAIHNPSP